MNFELSSEGMDTQNASLKKAIPLAAPTNIIPNQWYGVVLSRSVKKKPLAIRRLGENLILYRNTQDGVIAMLNRCPHRGMELTHGRVFGDEIECPFHAFRFNPEGKCTLMPCEGRDAVIPQTMRTISFPTREAHGVVWLWWGATAEDLGLAELPPIPWYDRIPETPYISSGEFLWPMPHQRVVENSIDGHHGPALHGQRRGVRGWKIGDIGRKTKTRSLKIDSVPGGFNSVYQMGDELRPDEKPFDVIVDYREPGMVYAVINKGLFLLTVDTPVDENNTWRIIFYFNMVAKIPVIGSALVWLMRIVDQQAIQWHEDFWIIKNQQEPMPDVLNHHYIKSDALISRYYAMQKRLMREAEVTRSVLPPIVQRHFGGLEMSDAGSN